MDGSSERLSFYLEGLSLDDLEDLCWPSLAALVFSWPLVSGGAHLFTWQGDSVVCIVMKTGRVPVRTTASARVRHSEGLRGWTVVEGKGRRLVKSGGAIEVERMKP